MKIIKIKSITFYNPENHYAIIKDEDDYSYQGNLYYPYKGQKIEVKTEIMQTMYGEQEKILMVKYFIPENKNQLIKLLSSGMISRIGDKTAEKVTNYAIIENNVENINSFFLNNEKAIEHFPINIQLKKSINHYVKFYYGFINSNTILSGKGFSQESIIKINELYGIDSLNIIEKNPYQLYKKIPLLSFLFLDKVAHSYQLSKTSVERILAGTYACIEEYCEENKSSGIVFEQLHQIGFKFLDIDEGTYYATLNHLLNDKNLCEITIDESLFISTPQIYYTELSIARNIKRLNFTSTKIKKTKNVPDFLSNEQNNSIDILLNNKLAILTGMPGSGKTTIIQYAVQSFLEQYPDKVVVVGTPTGKAAQRVKETNANLQVSTNHKLLGFLPNGEFIFNEKNKLKIDLLIVDETSMIDMYMFSNILKALPTHAKLWIIGDSNQLSSIQLGNILIDLIDSKIIAHTHLNKVFRQNEGSEILYNAIRVIDKKPIEPTIKEKNRDFYFFEEDNEMKIASSTIELFFKIKNNKNYHFNELQILCPQKTTLCGIDSLNSAIQKQLFNEEIHLKWKNKLFFKGDKVIQTINDYDRNIFNGDIGYIKDFSISNYQLIVYCNGQEIIYEKSQIEQLELAYAISVHKFQGSECKAVIIPISKMFSKMLTPKLIYTAMTRAKQLLVLNGNLSLFNECVLHNKDIERKTFLKYFIDENI